MHALRITSARALRVKFCFTHVTAQTLRKRNANRGFQSTVRMHRLTGRRRTNDKRAFGAFTRNTGETKLLAVQMQ
jgi:hypothetical protein